MNKKDIDDFHRLADKYGFLTPNKFGKKNELSSNNNCKCRETKRDKDYIKIVS